MIQVENLTKYYNESPALQDVTFTLNENEVTGLLGLNGAGKTTTIRMLTGYLIPSNGTVIINGINLFDNPIAAKGKIGYLPETPPLYEDMTVQEYLEFVCRIKGIPNEKIANAVHDACEETELTDKKNNILGQLSLGYRKRAGIAQAILDNPSFIVMDEPVSGLDPRQIIEMRNLIRRLGQKSTVLISSHILTEVYKTCDRFLLIREGKLVQEFTHVELENKMNAISGLEIGLSGADRTTLEKLLRELEHGLDPEWIRDEEDYSLFRVKATNQNEFRDKLIGAIHEKGYHLMQIRKPEITLEDIIMERI